MHIYEIGDTRFTKREGAEAFSGSRFVPFLKSLSRFYLLAPLPAHAELEIEKKLVNLSDVLAKSGPEKRTTNGYFRPYGLKERTLYYLAYNLIRNIGDSLTSRCLEDCEGLEDVDGYYWRRIATDLDFRLLPISICFRSTLLVKYVRK